MANDKRSFEELRRILNVARGQVQLGGLYQHIKSGNHYIPRSVSLREEDLEPIVAYAPLKAGTLEFNRPLKEWNEKFVRLPSPHR